MSGDMTLDNGWMPDADQQQLLIALFGPEHDTVAEWQKWRASTELDTIDLGMQRLIPLLHERLSDLDLQHGDQGRYRGVHRYWWLRNGKLRLQLAELIAVLGSAGVEECLIFGGIALIDTVYTSLAARPINDVDLMIREQDVSVAIGALRQIGFRPATCAAAAIESPWLDSLTQRQSGILLRCPDRGNVWLCWTTFGGESDIEGVWQRAKEHNIGEARVLTFGATDALVQVCIGGIRWSTVRPLWWIADALLLMRTHEIDWDLLIDQARRYGLALPLSCALTYLSATFGAGVPVSALNGLSALPVSRRDLERHRALITRRSDSRWRRAARLLDRYRTHRQVSSKGSLLDFLRIMRRRSVGPGGAA